MSRRLYHDYDNNHRYNSNHGESRVAPLLFIVALILVISLIIAGVQWLQS